MATVASEVSGVVFKLEVAVGDHVRPGQVICLLESMKMEVPLESKADGVVRELFVDEGDTVTEGDPVARIE